MRLASESENVLDLGELRSCGFTCNSVAARVRRGWITRIHQGVYAIGQSELSQIGRFIAAVKACGSDAALSHSSCAVFWQMAEWEDRPIDVTVASAHARCHQGVRAHRSKLVGRRDVRFRSGIWVVSPEWALLGLASQVGEETLKAAIRRGFARELVSVRSLAAVLGRAGPVRGSRKFARILSQGYRPARTVLEDVVLDLIVDGGFEVPEVNRRLVVDGRPLYPDFRWPEQRLIVEADSRMWHDDPISRANDAERQAILEADGERLVHVTFEQATAGRAQTLERIGQAGAPRPPSPAKGA